MNLDVSSQALTMCRFPRISSTLSQSHTLSQSYTSLQSNNKRRMCSTWKKVAESEQEIVSTASHCQEPSSMQTAIKKHTSAIRIKHETAKVRRRAR